MSDADAIARALDDWRADRAYVDGRGNYHVKRPGTSSGPVAPWNRAAKRAFRTVSDLHAAAFAIERKVS